MNKLRDKIFKPKDTYKKIEVENFKPLLFKFGCKLKLLVLNYKIFFITFFKSQNKMAENQLKSRVKKFLETERVSNSEFGELAGVSPAYVTSIKKNLSFEVLEKLYAINPRINLGWILWGKGEMYTNSAATIKILERENAELKEKVAMLQKIVDLQDRVQNAKK